MGDMYLDEFQGIEDTDAWLQCYEMQLDEQWRNRVRYTTFQRDRLQSLQETINLYTMDEMLYFEALVYAIILYERAFYYRKANA